MYDYDPYYGRRSYPRCSFSNSLYVGEKPGFTYVGNGYYENDHGGSDIYIERDSDGYLHEHRTL